VKLVAQKGGFETNIIFEWEGVICKARLDKYIHEAEHRNTILDLKKVQMGRAGDDKFQYSIRDYLYHMQAAWYCRAARSMHGEWPHFIWLVVEDKKPHGVNLIHCDAETMKIGDYLNVNAFEKYRLCVEKNEWPGYAQDLHTGGLPGWDRKQFEGLI